jgi:ribosomal protein L21E
MAKLRSISVCLDLFASFSIKRKRRDTPERSRRILSRKKVKKTILNFDPTRKLMLLVSPSTNSGCPQRRKRGIWFALAGLLLTLLFI